MPKIEEHKPKNLGDLLSIIENYQKDRDVVWYRGVSNHDYKLIPTIARSKSIKTENDLNEIEKKIAISFAQRSPPFLERDLQGAWKTMFFMQHYGIPTRLLDWSESPFVSLYFALASVARTKAGKPATDVALWACDPIAWNKTALSHISYQGGILDETRGCYEPATRVATCFVMSVAKATRWRPASVWAYRS